MQYMKSSGCIQTEKRNIRSEYTKPFDINHAFKKRSFQYISMKAIVVLRFKKRANSFLCSFFEICEKIVERFA